MLDLTTLNAGQQAFLGIMVYVALFLTAGALIQGVFDFLWWRRCRKCPNREQVVYSALTAPCPLARQPDHRHADRED